MRGRPVTMSSLHLFTGLCDQGVHRVDAPGIRKLRTARVLQAMGLDRGMARWVLLVGGPRTGPAVLFWSFFVVLLGVAVGLSRLPWTPLRSYHWVLLALGLSQVPIPAAAFVFGWLLLLGWRERRVELGGVWSFNLRQLAIIGVTLGALCILIAGLFGDGSDVSGSEH